MKRGRRLQTGDRVAWSLHEDRGVVIRKANLRPLRKIVDLLGPPTQSATVEEMDDAIRALQALNTVLHAADTNTLVRLLVSDALAQQRASCEKP